MRPGHQDTPQPDAFRQASTSGFCSGPQCVCPFCALAHMHGKSCVVLPDLPDLPTVPSMTLCRELYRPLICINSVGCSKEKLTAHVGLGPRRLMNHRTLPKCRVRAIIQSGQFYVQVVLCHTLCWYCSNHVREMQ